MYKIMLADDEGIAIESLKFIIERRFGDKCEIQYAKTGRSVIELAESFRPDIAFMDIHMPGMNGLNAMREIKKHNSNIIFIVMTAFDKFDYAKEAVEIGVLEYLSKPATREKIESVLLRAMAMVDKAKEKRNNDLRIQEKLETVVPFIESGLIYSLLLGEGSEEGIQKYLELLSVESKYAYVMVLRAGENSDSMETTNQVGNSVRLEEKYQFIRESLKERMDCLVGPVMSNKILVVVPHNFEKIEYAARVILIEKARETVHEIADQVDTELKCGIGSVKLWGDLLESYKEANSVLTLGTGSVAHADDVEVGSNYKDYPIDNERKLFESIQKGNVAQAVELTKIFGMWLAERFMENPEDVKLMVLEFGLWADKLAYTHGNRSFQFDNRTNYLSFINSTNDCDTLQQWLMTRVTDSAREIAKARTESNRNPVNKATSYIMEHYMDDISLEDVASVVEVSPYYLSKIFKEKEGVNFIDYLTDLRMKKAVELLEANTLSVKEVSFEVGYQDPNYFSRIFKKNFGVTPTEYRDGQHV